MQEYDVFTLFEVETHTGELTPCLACELRSAAIVIASALSSAMMAADLAKKQRAVVVLVLFPPFEICGHNL